jgi:hypothetical protein
MSEPAGVSPATADRNLRPARPSGRLGVSLHRLVRRPEFTTDLLQILKSVIAATGAWWVSTQVLHSQMPFLAPWTALLTVHATVYRSLSRGLQTTVASGIGVALSFAVGQYLGVTVWTFALALFIGLAGSRISWLRDEGVAIATTAIFVLGSGFSDAKPLLGDRLLEVGLGVAAGIIVNLMLIPPLRDQQAARYVDSINQRMGRVLSEMADEFSSSWDTDRADAWIDETVSMDQELQSAWQTVRFARESARLNPRRHVPVPRRPRNWRKEHPQAGQRVGYEDILIRVGEGISHLRHLARTLRESAYSESDWDTDFRQQWVGITRDAGRAIADPDAEVEPVYDRIDDLARNHAGDQEQLGELWPVYGSLITSIRHIAIIVDDVASAREARETGRGNPVA